MRAGIYARVAQSITAKMRGLQTRELRQLAQSRGWQIAGEYVDADVGAAKDSRPELNRLMLDAKRRRFDVVLVWKLDSFGRSLRHLVNALAEFAFVPLSDNLDLNTASGRLMFNIIGAMAEFERELIRERVRAGMKNARAKGRACDRGRRENSGSTRFGLVLAVDSTRTRCQRRDRVSGACRLSKKPSDSRAASR